MIRGRLRKRWHSYRVKSQAIRLTSGNYPSLKSVLDKRQIDVLLVDYFDSLVHRTVYPEYTKKLHAKRMSAFLGLPKVTPQLIYDLRVQAERSLAAEAYNQGYDGEFDLEELNSELYRLLGSVIHPQQLAMGVQEFVNESIKLELNIEKQVQRVDHKLVETLRQLKPAGKSLILVSDFYLSADAFDELLDHHGIRDLFDARYISCEYKLNKRSGRLYSYVLARERLLAERVAMLGDNLIADVESARNSGIIPIWVDRSAQHRWYRKLMGVLDTEASAQLWLYQGVTNRIGQIPFDRIVPILHLFCARLFQQLQSRGVKDVFFLSREGQILKDLFEIYQERTFGKVVIPAHYMLASRRATFMASLDSLEYESFETLVRQYGELTVSDFLRNLGFSRDEVESVLADIELEAESDQPNRDFVLSGRLNQLRESKVFQNLYEQKRQQQREIINQYISDFGADLSQGMHIVDIGWKGTMQDQLRRILPEQVTLHGYYLGLDLPVATKLSAANTKQGIVFANFPADTPYARVYRESMSLFEVLCLADHGSARAYKLVDGKPSVELEQMSEEDALFSKVIGPMQESYRQSFSEIVDMFGATHFYETGWDEWFAKYYAGLMYFPTRQESQMFSQMYHYENFGVFRYTRFGYQGSSFSQFLRFLYKSLRDPKSDDQLAMWPTVIVRQAVGPILGKLYGYWRQRVNSSD